MPNVEEQGLIEATSQTDYVFSGVEMRCVLTGRDTNKTFCLFENTSASKSGTPIHIHTLEDETVVVLDGEMCAVIAGTARTILPGEAVFLPRGVPHQLKNESGAPSHYIVLCSPSGFEDFVASAGHIRKANEPLAPPTPEEILAMKKTAPRYGIKLLRSFEE